MKKILMSLLMTFSVSSTHALSLVYEGQTCPVSGNNKTEESQITMQVVGSKGHGIFELNISGGHLIVGTLGTACIDTNLGVVKEDDQSLPFEQAPSIKGTAYFDGTMLIISVGTHTIARGEELSSKEYLSLVNHSSHQYYFKFNRSDSTLVLQNVINQFDFLLQSEATQRLKSTNLGPLYPEPKEPIILTVTED